MQEKVIYGEKANYEIECEVCETVKYVREGDTWRDGEVCERVYERECEEC